jgi:hypothetical protein
VNDTLLSSEAENAQLPSAALAWQLHLAERVQLARGEVRR